MQVRQEKPIRQLKKCKAYGPCASVFVSANTGSWRLERPQVNFEACARCGTCQMFCPADLITIDKESPECVRIDWDYCKGCGICANECPKQCIEMVNERGAR